MALTLNDHWMSLTTSYSYLSLLLLEDLRFTIPRAPPPPASLVWSVHRTFVVTHTHTHIIMNALQTYNAQRILEEGRANTYARNVARYQNEIDMEEITVRETTAAVDAQRSTNPGMFLDAVGTAERTSALVPGFNHYGTASSPSTESKVFNPDGKFNMAQLHFEDGYARVRVDDSRSSEFWAEATFTAAQVEKILTQGAPSQCSLTTGRGRLSRVCITMGTMGWSSAYTVYNAAGVIPTCTLSLVGASAGAKTLLLKLRHSEFPKFKHDVTVPLEKLGLA